MTIHNLKMNTQKTLLLIFIFCGLFRAHAQVYEKVFSFTTARLTDLNSSLVKGSQPEGTLIQASDGTFYGMTYGGGIDNGFSGQGTVFKMTPSGVLTTLVEFTGRTGNYKGNTPYGSGLTQGRDGNLYGMTYSGGVNNIGTIFKMTPAGVFTTLAEFTGTSGTKGGHPRGSLTQGEDGNFYGTTNDGGASNLGTIFRITPNGTFTTLVEFTGTSGLNKGASPYGGLVLIGDGNFYGTTSLGGSSNLGTVFKVTPSGTLTTLVEFTGNGTDNKGSNPWAPLAKASDGLLYGTTTSGGLNNLGTVFKVTPDGILTTLVNCSSATGSAPRAGVLQGNDGNLYGATGSSIYKITLDGVFIKLANKGCQSSLAQGADGAFYGGTSTGGTNNSGTIFKITPGGIYTTVLSFSGFSERNTGAKPYGKLAECLDGNFYGTTYAGGPDGFSGDGTIFRLTPSGTLTTLLELGTNGPERPTAGMIRGSDGNLYGASHSGGANFRGCVYKYNPQTGVVTVLASFTGTSGNTKGSYPDCDLIEGSDGSLYGTTSYGGASDLGTVFKLSPTGVFATLAEFTGTTGNTKGSHPAAGLALGADGSLYGTTPDGGSGDFNGTIFRIDPSGVFSTLVEFGGSSSPGGSSPEGHLILASDGDLYGTTSQGGSSGGTVFKMTPSGVITTMVNLPASSSSLAGLLEGSDGNFYGTTYRGGTNSKGTVFKMTPAGVLTILYNFGLDSEDNNPRAPLMQASDGNLYGTTSSSDAGNVGAGSIYRLIMPGSPNIFQMDADVRGSTSAVATCQLNARGSATGVTLEYGTDGITFPNILQIAANVSGYQTRIVGTSLDGLIAGSIYHYRFRASSAAGTEVSGIQSFSTLAEPLVNLVSASELTPTSGRMNASVNARGYDSTVVFEWGSDGNTFPNAEDASPSSVSGNSFVPVSVPLAGLTPGQTYFYRVVATNAAGTVISGTQNFRTLTPATAAVTGTAALSTTRALITGLVDAEGSTADVSFEYGTDGINFPNSFAATPSSVSGDSPVEVTATLTGLTQGTTYHVRIRAQGPGGTGLSAASTFSLSILSGLVQLFPDLPPASGGSVTVNFSPANVGAWRFAGDTSWLNSGVTYGNLAAGQRTIEFLPIPGFISPPSETVDVIGSANLPLDRLYFDTPTAGSGSLTVRLKPDEISAPSVPEADRAQWRIVGEAAWRDGGTTLGSLVAGSYLVECKPVAGRETPPPIPVSLAAGDARDITLTYFTANTSAGSPPLPQSFADVSANEDMPFAHVGQIRSEVGSSTGFVVKRRVVATAGHVVFDDGTLSAITNLQWIFQRHKGTHEPRPQTPRGYYLAAGYAAQREIDQSPGEGSAQSQNLDYASLYFTEEAGRGGYGGYLASDSGDDNEFLDSTAQKILAGYPTSGIPSTDSGKLHATAPFTSALTPAFGETWTTTAVRGLGGMSGGPLFVRYQSGAYLPAAIYLGGAGQTVVRAINSDVVDLFLRAEVSGNGGDNNTDGGITHTSVAGNLNTTQAGALRVNIVPAGAIAVGAAWQLNPETILRQSGSQKSGLSPGTYSLTFKTITGFQTPANQTVTLTGGQLTTITYTYTPTGSQTPLETWRQTHFGTTANTGDAADNFDFDKDGETNIEEFTDGTNPLITDSDFDGLSDGEEKARGTNPLSGDSDGDGLGDLEEEVFTRTNPLSQDSDGNGIADALEDPDRDGILNGREVNELGTDPTSNDSDNDGLSDTYELIFKGSPDAFKPRIGDRLSFDLRELGFQGTYKLVGKLPVGLTFNPATGLLEGKLTDKVLTSVLAIQILEGTTVVRSIPLTLPVGAFPTTLTGTWQALVEDDNGLPQGLLTTTLSAPGKWTATLDVAGSKKIRKATGTFELDPSAETATIGMSFPAATGLTAQSLTLSISGPNALASGTHLQGVMRGFRLARGAELPTTTKAFTLVIDQGEQDGFLIPAGLGWATGSISNKGLITLNGQLGDAHPIKCTLKLGATGQVLLWLKPYPNLTSNIGGVLSLYETGAIPATALAQTDRKMWWYRAPDNTELSYPSGFAAIPAEVGVRSFTIPASSIELAQTLGLTQQSFRGLVFDGGGLPDPDTATTLPESLVMNASFNLAAVPIPDRLMAPWQGSINAKTGAFTGTLDVAASTSGIIAGKATANGVLFPAAEIDDVVGAGLLKIPIASQNGSFRTGAMILSR